MIKITNRFAMDAWILDYPLRQDLPIMEDYMTDPLTLFIAILFN